MEIEEQFSESSLSPCSKVLAYAFGSSMNSGEADLLSDPTKLTAMLEFDENEDILHKRSKGQKIIFNVAGYRLYDISLSLIEAEYDIIKYVGKKIFNWELSLNPAEDWDIYWTDSSVPIEKLARMQPYQKVNHFPGMHSIARKNNLGRNLMKMKKVFPDSYKFFPKTFVLPGDYQELKNHLNKNKKQKIFIVKPEAESQGKGIYLTKNFDNIGPKDHLIAQKYLANPLLINGLKFDLRLYVLVTGCDPLRIFLYKDGLGRFATEEYRRPSTENLANTCMHLTNYAINKENPNFIFNNSSTDDSIGHKKSLKAVFKVINGINDIKVFKILKEQGHNVEILWEEIKNIIRKVFCSIQPILAHNYKSCQPNEPYNNMCFEILGFDVMIDDKLKPWLIEVNHLPSFGVDTPLDVFIKKNVVRDAFQLMNISVNDRIEFKNKKKNEVHKRSLSARTFRVTNKEKEETSKKAQKERDEWELHNCGGYEKIFPLAENTIADEDYEGFIKVAHQYWEVWTGTTSRKDMVKSLTKPGELNIINENNNAKTTAPTAPPKKLKLNIQSPILTTKSPERKSGRKMLLHSATNDQETNEVKDLQVNLSKTGTSFFSKARSPSSRTHAITQDSWNRRPYRSPNPKKANDSEIIQKNKEVNAAAVKLAPNIQNSDSPNHGIHVDLAQSAVFLPKIIEAPETRVATADVSDITKDNSIQVGPSSATWFRDPSKSEIESNNQSSSTKLTKARSQFEASKGNFEIDNSKEGVKNKHIRQLSGFVNPEPKIDLFYPKTFKNNFMGESYQKSRKINEESLFFINRTISKASKTALITLEIDLTNMQQKEASTIVKAAPPEMPRNHTHASPVKRPLLPQSCRTNITKNVLFPKGIEPTSTFNKSSYGQSDFSMQGDMILQGKSISRSNNLRQFKDLLRDMSKRG